MNKYVALGSAIALIALFAFVLTTCNAIKGIDFRIPVIQTEEPVFTQVIPTPSSEPTKTPEPTQTPKLFILGSEGFEKLESGELVELFPGSEVYLAERGDVVIINRESGLQFAGQIVETKYGTFTLLLSDSHYQEQVKRLLSEENLAVSASLSNYPADWVEERQFRQGVEEIISTLSRLQGFRDGSEHLGGYPNMVDNPYKEEIMRIISSLIDLKEGKIGFDVNLVTYQPEAKDFIMIYMKPFNAVRLANILPKGLVNPDETGFMIRYTPFHIGYSTIETESGVFVNALFAVSTQVEHYPNPERNFYRMFSLFYIEMPFRILMREAGREQGVYVEFSLNSFFDTPLAPLFTNPEVFNSLTAFHGSFADKTTLGMGGATYSTGVEKIRDK